MQKKRVGILVLLLCCLVAVGCKNNVMSTMLPSMFGEDTVFGENVEDMKEQVYGHITIDLPSTFIPLGTVDVMWNPAIVIPGLLLPQYLSTTMYERDGTYYLTQWTQLGTNKYYFEPLNNETTERWGTEWQLTTFTVPTNTANHEYGQYMDYIKKTGFTLPASFAVKLYSKRFSGRIIVRVLEFIPSTGVSVLIPQFKELYPLVAYDTVEQPAQ